MYFRTTKKLNNEVYLEDPIGKDKDDNTISLKDILENDERTVEEEIDFKLRLKNVYQKIKEVLKERERKIIEMRFGLDGKKPKTQIEIAKQLKISRSYVSRIESKALEKIKNEFKNVN